ncbi:DUF3152 domain-containing protein [Micromonospora sp. NBC_01699]|uniref:DUF3152 domain-containing protein n=1 Tax=Micromonospora sp. NBC_01699 TaxID=2975984 RepID=UPI002E296D31|nr:DUF3152 domain-containing protein [Micromonospora sp. NBC_01699]
MAVLVAVVGVLLGLVGPPLLDRLSAAERPVTAGPKSIGSAVQPPVTATSAPAVVQAPTPPLLRMPGPVPQSGRDSFRYATGAGKVVGHAGTLRRYRVATEDGSGEDVKEFSSAVEEALGDPRSWTGSGQLRLQRVPDGSNYDFTVYLATADTAARMCAAGGTDIRIGGKPYTSCRTPGKVIINLNRWMLSVDYLVAAKLPLATYRLYVINHETGHQLGHGHEQCLGKGKPAPVMQQQTLFLNGCTVNPWPYLDGARYEGPPV